MDNTAARRLPQCRTSLLSDSQERRLREALRLMEGLWRLPLETDPMRAEEIKSVYGNAERREKK